MMADRGQNYELHLELNPNHTNSRFVREILQQLNLPHQIFQNTNVLSTKNKENMLSLCRFFALVDCVPPKMIETSTTEEKARLQNTIL